MRVHQSGTEEGERGLAQLDDIKEASIKVMSAAAKAAVTVGVIKLSRAKLEISCMHVCVPDCGWLAHLHF